MDTRRTNTANPGGGAYGEHGLARFGRPQILRAPEGDGGGGGGVPAAAGGSRLDQQTIDTINAAVSSQLDRKLTAAVEKLPLQQLISQGIQNALPGALEGVTTKLSETLGAQIAKIGQPTGDQAGAGDKAGKAKAGGEDLAKVQTQLDELKATIADKDRQLAAQQAEQAERQIVDGARAAFLKAGVKEPMVDAVIALHKARGTFKQDKDGAHVMVKRKSAHGEWSERLDVDKFAAEFVATDEGKHYVPAAGTQRRGAGGGVDRVIGGNGNGDRPLAGGNGGPRQQTGEEKRQGDVAVGEMLINALHGDPG